MLSPLRSLGKIKRRYWLIVVVVIVIVAWLVYLRRHGYVWQDFTGFEGKTLWDIFELLIIPVTLAVVAAYLDKLERKADREIAEKRAEVDREITRDNQQEALLQNYFDAMTKLILEKDLRSDDSACSIAQVKTNTTLEWLDINRKAKLINFLSTTGLITVEKGKTPVIDINNIKLQNIDLAYAWLKGADLSASNLEGAHLELADLGNAHLEFTRLENAHLEYAHLEKASLDYAKLKGANLEGAYVDGANFLGAIMPDGKEYDPSIHTREYLTGRATETEEAEETEPKAEDSSRSDNPPLPKSPEPPPKSD